jgi:deazaflavin-dependent oxidoreductase (nitroreductase family)
MGLTEDLQGLGLRAHQWCYERSDGRVGHHLGGLRTLLLRTTGRRSGRTRTAALVYVDDGPGRYVVVASNGGSEHAPGWWHNLRADPHAEVQVRRDRYPVTASEPTGAERERLWVAVNENNRYRGGGRYDHYQAMTDRPIPVVVLTRDAGGSEE